MVSLFGKGSAGALSRSPLHSGFDRLTDIDPPHFDFSDEALTPDEKTVRSGGLVDGGNMLLSDVGEQRQEACSAHYHIVAAKSQMDFVVAALRVDKLAPMQHNRFFSGEQFPRSSRAHPSS